MNGLKGGARCVCTVLLGLSLLFFGGCGYKKPPVPPESVVPEPINDLRYTVDSKGVELSWTFPHETIKGTNINDIDSFEVFRAVILLEDYCGDCPIPFGEPTVIPGGEPSVETKRKAVHQESLLRTGHKYFYKVRSRTSWWAASEDSNIISFVYYTPSKAPEGVTLTTEGQNLVLSWRPVLEFLDGSTVDLPVNYQVLRSEGGKDFKAVGRPVKDARYVDTKVEQGQKYFYKVQSLILLEGEIAKGGISEVVDDVPRDTTPPSVVTGVTAVRTAAGIKIIWDRSSDADVAGYRVYRRVKNQKKVKLLGEVERSYTIFVDDNVPADRRVYYSITAIDMAEPVNESKPSKEATVRH